MGRRIEEQQAGTRRQGHDELRVDMQLCLALQIASSQVTAIYRRLLAPLGLSHGQYLVLIALWQTSDRLNMGDLRRTLSLDTGSLTPLVKRMEASGLVRRVRDDADERRVWVDLTEAGKNLEDEILRVRHDVVQALPLSDEQLSMLRDSLRAMSSAIDANTRAAKPGSADHA